MARSGYIPRLRGTIIVCVIAAVALTATSAWLWRRGQTLYPWGGLYPHTVRVELGEQVFYGYAASKTGAERLSLIVNSAYTTERELQRATMFRHASGSLSTERVAGDEIVDVLLDERPAQTGFYYERTSGGWPMRSFLSVNTNMHNLDWRSRPVVKFRALGVLWRSEQWRSGTLTGVFIDPLGVVAGMAMWSAVVVIAWKTPVALRRLLPRAKKGYCRGCGYDLRGTEAWMRCPECGRVRRATGDR